MGSEANPVLIGIVMGSDSDLAVMEGAAEVLSQWGVSYEMRILSAHRSPEATCRYAREAAQRGVKVIIAGAGWAAHLAGSLAAHTTLPVIGVPIDSSALQGLDALLATVQMPPGIPVATMAIGKGGARNAALYALAILALGDPALAEKMRAHREEMAQQVAIKDRHLRTTRA